MTIVQFQAVAIPYFRPDNGQPEAKVQIYGLGDDGMPYFFDFAEKCWLPA